MRQVLLIAGGSTAIYLLLAILMAVIPGYELSQVPPLPGLEPLTPLQAAGRDVFVAEGCSYCHTQQVRPLQSDAVFGRPSVAGDYAYMTPELLGSERTGPDLSNIGARQPSKIWQYMHLYEPRSVVSWSIMPAFPWLFEVVDKAPAGTMTVPIPKQYAPQHGVVVPTHKARALVAYLLSRKQVPLQDAKKSDGSSPHTRQAAGHSGKADAPPAGFDAAKGKRLFSANCAACHQASGTGLPGVFPALKGNAVVNNADPRKHIRVVLFGLQGSTIGGVTYHAQMPAFSGILDDAEIAGVINHERTSWGNNAPLVSAADVAAVRAGGK